MQYINSTGVKDIEEKRLSVGKPMFMKLRIVNEKGEDVPKGEKGELFIRSAAMFSGYWGDPRRQNWHTEWLDAFR
ncbi:MAG: AMP-binding protein [Clostridium sp.]